MAEGTSLAIKGSFKGETSYGAFYIIIDIVSEKFSSCRFAIKNGSSLKNMDLHTDFSVFSKKIDDIFENIDETDPVFDYIASLESSFIKSFPDEKLQKIINLLNSSGDDYLRNILIRDILSEEIKKYFTDLMGKVNIQIEFSSQEEDKASDNKEPPSNTMENTMLIVRALMDPINGISVEKLTPGEKIIVKLNDPSDLEQFYDKLTFFYDSKDISKAKVIAEITEIKEPENEELQDLKIMIKLSPKLYSLLILQPKLKIMATDNEDKISENYEATSNEDLFSSNIIIIISGLVIIIILLIILFIIFN